MQEFFLIRHGETDWNIKLGKLQGHSDIPLNEKGLLQAKALRDLTAGLGIQKVISSDLNRAYHTAQEMTNFEMEIEVHKDLREVHLGVGEGLTWDEVSEQLGPTFRLQWTSNLEDYMDIRFPKGESRREVIERVKNCLFYYLEKYPNQKLAFVSHGYVIRTLLYHCSPQHPPVLIPNCAVLPFSYQGGKIFYKGSDRPELLLKPNL